MNSHDFLFIFLEVRNEPMGFAIVTFIVAFIHVIAGAVVLHKYPQYKSIAISVIVLGFLYGVLTVGFIVL